jgi:hypothetical protein
MFVARKVEKKQVDLDSPAKRMPAALTMELLQLNEPCIVTLLKSVIAEFRIFKLESLDNTKCDKEFETTLPITLAVQDTKSTAALVKLTTSPGSTTNILAIETRLTDMDDTFAEFMPFWIVR